jgi:hypothetical protein
MLCDSGITVPVGGTLYALSHRFSDKQQSLEAMSWDHNPNGGLDELQHPTTEGWSWKSLPAPPPTFTSATTNSSPPTPCTRTAAPSL